MHLDIELHGAKERVFQCQNKGCMSIWGNNSIGTIRFDNYFKLYCIGCNSTDIKLIKEYDNE